jgi:hypothetical protein
MLCTAAAAGCHEVNAISVDQTRPKDLFALKGLGHLLEKHDGVTQAV